MSPEALQAHMLAAHGHGIAAIVRIEGPNVGHAAGEGVTQPWGTHIKAALDAGADGVIVPQVRTAAEVRAIVADCRYPTGPLRIPPFDAAQVGSTAASGWHKRGFSSAALNQSGLPLYEYLNEADQSVFVCVMLETQEAVDNIEAICAVPGLDSVCIGGAQLAAPARPVQYPSGTIATHRICLRTGSLLLPSHARRHTCRKRPERLPRHALPQHL